MLVAAILFIVGYALIELLVYFLLILNIEGIRNKKIGSLYNYAKMKLGKRF